VNRTLCVLVATLVVTASAFAGFYFCAQPLGHFFGLSDYASGIKLVPVLVICVGCVLMGTVVGVFLFPLVLRPFVSSSDFWSWIRAERGVRIPVLDPILERRAVLLYAKRNSAKGGHGN
jgi:hypothetical protein